MRGREKKNDISSIAIANKKENTLRRFSFKVNENFQLKENFIKKESALGELIFGMHRRKIT